MLQDEKFNITLTLAADADRVWHAIAAADGLERWFDIIAACRLEGSGVGALRHMVLSSGEIMVDRIEAIDHTQRVLRYTRIESPFPVDKYQGEVRVSAVGAQSAEINWTVTVDVAEAERAALAELVVGAISGGIRGLERELLQQQQQQQ